MEASLLVLAAGMGSRYGSLKQLDAFGPNGETIIDYSIYDAIAAGFTKIVFVVRKSFRKDIEDHFRSKLEGKVKLAFVEQELDKLPKGFELNLERKKPWGTAHAVMMGEEVIDGHFAVINADDYYGVNSYKTLIDFFKNGKNEAEFAVVSYLLENTLSDHGTVNRGICYQDEKGYLTQIVETLKISKNKDQSIEYPDNGGSVALTPDTLVSMNMFGFTNVYFKHADHYFREFLKEKGHELKSEFFIPFLLDRMINDNLIKVKVLTSPDNWFGVTYIEDKPIVMQKIEKLIQAGVYPEKLW